VPVSINVRVDLKAITRSLDVLARQQVPFAAATALTALARRVQEAEKAGLKEKLNRPTPFTINSVGVRSARKDNLTALVFVRDIAASYLEPFEFGGRHKLNSQALLNPKDIKVNQYGNLPRTQLQRLKGRADIFIGAIVTARGVKISGVWQRLALTRSGGKRRKRAGRGSTYSQEQGPLKLLIRFGDALEVHQTIGYRARAAKIVHDAFAAEFGAAMAKALATAR
jgi:hypothetical protein